MSDPFELLARLNTADDSYLEPGDDAAADSLLDRITRSADKIPDGDCADVLSVRRRRRRRVAIAVGVVTLVGTGTAAAIGWWTAKPKIVTQISCYSDASLQPATQVQTSAAPGQSPVERCAPFWSKGPLSYDGAPLLVACVNAAGLVAVVPGTNETCSSLNMAVSDGTTIDNNDSAGQALKLTTVLIDVFDGTCMTESDARTAIAKVLDGLHLTDWPVVEPAPLTAQQPCARPAVNEADHNILLVGTPS